MVRLFVVVILFSFNVQVFGQNIEQSTMKNFTIMYRPGSADLSKKSRVKLDEFAVLIQDTSRKFYLIGYGCCTDEAIKLSHRRIQVILQYLTTNHNVGLDSLFFMIGVESGAGPNMVDIGEGSEGAAYDPKLFPNLLK